MGKHSARLETLAGALARNRDDIDEILGELQSDLDELVSRENHSQDKEDKLTETIDDLQSAASSIEDAETILSSIANEP